MREIILLAHGSPDPRSGIAMRRFAKKLERQIGTATDIAFLDHEGPTLTEASKNSDPREVLVVPMLFSNAFHARVDVPSAMEDAGLHNVLPPIGNPLKILRKLISNAETDVLVVAAGTSDRNAQKAFEAAVILASKGLSGRADIAFVTGREKNLKTELATLRNPEAFTIIPWLLAEGRLLDVVLTQAIQHGASVQGNGLVEEATFLEHLCETIQLFLRSEPYLV